MNQANEFLAGLLKRFEASEEAQKVLLTAGEQLMEQRGEEMERLCARFMENPTANYQTVFEDLDRAAESCGIHSYTASFVFLCWNVMEMQERYRVRGISEEILWDTAADLRWKLAECWDVYHIWGTFVRNWYPGFFALTRFALGRLQYEITEYRGAPYTAGGFTISEGDRVLTMHIPSCGPLTKELREDSYRRAQRFHEKDFPGTPVPFYCISWLLYPPHEEMLPKNSNIISFMHDFDPLAFEESDGFSNDWRIFGADAGKPAAELPRHSSIQRAYADRLMNGGKTGWGSGIFFFDGKHFIRKDGSKEHL